MKFDNKNNLAFYGGRKLIKKNLKIIIQLVKKNYLSQPK